jgi:hypothetical protein
MRNKRPNGPPPNDCPRASWRTHGRQPHTRTPLCTRSTGSKAMLGRKAQGGVGERPARCPNELHAHVLRNKDPRTDRELVVQRR